MIMQNFLKVTLFIAAILFCAPLFADDTSTTTTTTTTQSDNSAATSSDDATITSNIQSKISQDSSLSGANITVSTQQGVVTLDGTANTQAQIDTATNEAKSVTGVKDVKSNIQLSNSNNTSNTSNSSY